MRNKPLRIQLPHAVSADERLSELRRLKSGRIVPDPAVTQNLFCSNQRLPKGCPDLRDVPENRTISLSPCPSRGTGCSQKRSI